MNDIEKLQRYRASKGHKPDFIASRYEHCADRFQARYHLDLSEAEWEELNLALFLETSDCRYVKPGDTAESGLYIVKWRGQNIFVAYSEVAYLLLTAFPRHDMRFLAALSNREDGFAPSPDMLAFRDDKNMIADGFDRMTFNRLGEVVLAEIPVAAYSKDQAAPANAMAEALANFKPTPTIEASISAAYANVDRTLLLRSREIEHECSRNQAKISELEGEIERLRAHQTGFATQVEYLNMQRDFAASAFARLSAGEIDDASAQRIADMMLANISITKSAA
jgi:hypothetical protein